MRRILFVLLIFMILLIGILPSLALDTSVKVYDEAGLFTSDESAKLQDTAKSLTELNQMDVVIVTISDAEGKSSMAYADDYYDYNGFGYGSEKSGILLLIDMDNRDVWISTTGLAIRYFTDSAIDSILDKITGYLSDGQYYKAADIFLDQVGNYFSAGIDSNQYNYNTETGERDYYQNSLTGFEKSVSHIPIFLLISIAIAGIVVGIMSINNKGKKTINPSTYLDENSFILRDNRDIYIRTATTTRFIDTSSGGGSGGRSSTHSGSSGSSHGGGGRSF